MTVMVVVIAMVMVRVSVRAMFIVMVMIVTMVMAVASPAEMVTMMVQIIFDSHVPHKVVCHCVSDQIVSNEVLYQIFFHYSWRLTILVYPETLLLFFRINCNGEGTHVSLTCRPFHLMVICPPWSECSSRSHHWFMYQVAVSSTCSVLGPENLVQDISERQIVGVSNKIRHLLL